MRIKKLMRNKKAFSAIIASLILMLLAVAAGVVVYAYVMGWIGGAQQTSTPGTGRLQMDSITATNSTAKINLYVRNTGGGSLVLSSFYVQGVAVTPSNTYKTALPVQGTVNLQFKMSTLNTGTYYTVQVVCTDGTTVSTSVEAR